MTKGFSIIEVILSVAIASIVSATLLPTIGWLSVKSAQSKSNQEASLLLQEGIEIAYNTLLTEWDVADGEYHPAVLVDGLGRSVWTLGAGSEGLLQAKYQRRLEVESVCRDTNTGEEDADGCVEDQSSKRVVSSVVWTERGIEKRLESQLLVANLAEL